MPLFRMNVSALAACASSQSARPDIHRPLVRPARKIIAIRSSLASARCSRPLRRTVSLSYARRVCQRERWLCVVDRAFQGSHNSHDPWLISMIPRTFLITLVFALPILVLALAVVLGAAALASALGDAAGSRGLLWAAVADGLLLV